MRTSIVIQNLKCGGCAKTITKRLAEIDGITEIEVCVETATVSFTVNTEQATTSAKEKLKELGYPSIEDPNGVYAKAKSFVSCATGRLSQTE
ncbi:MAG: heavy metal transporter [Cytophagaceae bacterium]|nr:heavy metal transporter [Cytophagaceae bacterium]